jgi:uncharacterized protein (UPF0335 family)
MVELDRQGFADRQFKSVQAARQERAAKRAEKEYFMRSFNPNTATREDFTRFREGLKNQALDAIGPRQGGILNSRQAQQLASLYSDPYRKMMNQYRITNPESYSGNFPISSFIQSAGPKLMGMGIGALSGVPGLSKMFDNKADDEILGDYSYLKYRPTRLESQPDNMSDELWEIIMDAYNQGFETSPEDSWYSQFYPMNVPDYFYQFMDDEILPYKLGIQ